MKDTDISPSIPEEIPEGFSARMELKFESIISEILRIGVVFSGLFMLVGFLLTITTNYSIDLSTVTLNWILTQFFQLSPVGILFMGILILLLTPVARVLSTIILYLSIKEWDYVMITSFVLFFMLLGVILGVK